MIKLKNLIIESESDELIKIARYGNGLISPNGKPHYVPELNHADFLVTQPKYKQFADRLKMALKSRGNDYAILYDAILKDAMKNGWIRIVTSKNYIGINGEKKFIKKNNKLIGDIIMFIESVKKINMTPKYDYIN